MSERKEQRPVMQEVTVKTCDECGNEPKQGEMWIGFTHRPSQHSFGNDVDFCSHTCLAKWAAKQAVEHAD